jgi:hypothetical protein
LVVAISGVSCGAAAGALIIGSAGGKKVALAGSGFATKQRPSAAVQQFFALQLFALQLFGLSAAVVCTFTELGPGSGRLSQTDDVFAIGPAPVPLLSLSATAGFGSRETLTTSCTGA